MNETIETVIINFPTFAGLIVAIVIMRQWIYQMRENQDLMSQRIAVLESRLDECLERIADK